MDLYLIRHGESYFNVNGTAQANPDTPLTPRGERQAAALGKWIRQALPTLDYLYASTMQRTRQTAAFVAEAYGCEIVFEDRLREVGNNYRDHSPVAPEKQPRVYRQGPLRRQPFMPVALDVENGESLMHLRTRVGMFLEELIAKHYGQKVVVVCHSGVMNGFVEVALNIGSYRRCEIKHEYTSLTHLQYDLADNRSEPWILHYLGRKEHLVDVS